MTKRKDMWLVSASAEQGVWDICFVKGTEDKEEAIKVGLERLGYGNRRPPCVEATRVDNAITIKKEKT